MVTKPFTWPNTLESLFDGGEILEYILPLSQVNPDPIDRKVSLASRCFLLYPAAQPSIDRSWQVARLSGFHTRQFTLPHRAVILTLTLSVAKGKDLP